MNKTETLEGIYLDKIWDIFNEANKYDFEYKLSLDDEKKIHKLLHEFSSKQKEEEITFGSWIAKNIYENGLRYYGNDGVWVYWTKNGEATGKKLTTAELYNEFKNIPLEERHKMCDKCGMKVKWDIILKD